MDIYLYCIAGPERRQIVGRTEAHMRGTPLFCDDMAEQRVTFFKWALVVVVGPRTVLDM